MKSNTFFDTDRFLAKTLSEHENETQPQFQRSVRSDGAKPKPVYRFHQISESNSQKIKPVIRKEDFSESILGKDIVRSVEYSVDAELLQSTHKQKLENEIQKLQENRNIDLNIIICGGKQVGKTSFIQNFQNAKLCNIDAIKSETSTLVTKKCVRRFQGIIYNIALIDTPGYREGQISQYLKNIKNQIKKRLKSHHKKSQQQKKDRRLIIQGKSQNSDQRIHCCLYFLKGPRLHEEDFLIMAGLQDYVNIIPIISKSDCYTVKQISQIKKRFHQAKQRYKLKLLQCEEIVQTQHPSMIKSLLEGPFGSAPPFVIVSGVSNILTNQDRMIQGRQYSWGMIDINNRNHSDFQLLCQMLLSVFSKPMIELTDFIQNEYIINSLKKRKLIKSGKYILAGISVCLMGYCLFKFMSKKQQSK